MPAWRKRLNDNRRKAQEKQKERKLYWIKARKNWRDQRNYAALERAA